MLRYTTYQCLSITENVTLDTLSIIKGTFKLYLKLKKKCKTDRGVLQQCEGDVLDIEKVVPIKSDEALSDTNVKVELINPFGTDQEICHL